MGEETLSASTVNNLPIIIIGSPTCVPDFRKSRFVPLIMYNLIHNIFL